MSTQAVSNGVPSTLGKWKIFNNSGDELTEVKAAHLDNPPRVSFGIFIAEFFLANATPTTTKTISVNAVFFRLISNGLIRRSQTSRAGFTCLAPK